jgi:hypothetical protein
MSQTIQVTPRQILAYILITIAIIFLMYVAINVILLANGTIQPIRVATPSLVYGADVIAGILLQIGVYGVLVGVSFVLGTIGVKLAVAKTD